MRTKLGALALVTLMLASTFVPSVPTASAQGTGADLEVKDVRTFDSNGGGPVVNVSKSVTAIVHNWGPSSSGAFDLTFYWGATGTNYLTEGVGTGGTTAEGKLPATQSVVHVTSPIGVGDDQQFTIPWTPAPDQAGLGNINATTSSQPLIGNADPKGGNNWRIEPVTVQRAAVKLFREWNDTRDWRDIKTRCPSEGIAPTSCLILPGEQVHFLVAVDNVGNMPDTFTPSIDDPNDVLHIADAAQGDRWNVSFFPQRVAGASGTNSSLEMIVQSPVRSMNDGLAGYAINNFSSETSYNVSIKAASGANPNVIAKLGFPKIRVGQVYKLNFSSNETYRKGDVSRPIKFNLSVGNQGNGRDQFQFRLEKTKSDIDGSWSPRFTAQNITVGPYGTSNTTFSVTPPTNATRGFHTIWIEAFSNKDPTGNAFGEKKLVAYVNQFYALSGGSNTPSQSKAPADPATFRITVHNDGNGPDNLSTTVANMRSDWTATLTPTRATVGPHNSTVFLLNVTSPAFTPANLFTDVFVNVTSQDPAHVFTEQKVNLSVKSRVTVVTESNFRLTPLNGLGPRFVDAGKSLRFTFNVQNLGNEEDTLAFSKQISDTEWMTNVTPALLDLKPGGSQTVTVDITSPQNGALGSSANVILTATPGDAASTVRQLTYVARISGPDLSVPSITTSPANVYSGDPVSVVLTVANLGNVEAGKNVTVRVVASQGGIERVIAVPDVGNLGGGTERTVNLSWNTTNVEGPMTLIARIDPQDQVPEIDETNNQASSTVFVRRFAIHLTPALGRSAVPGERVQYLSPPNAFVISNDGNAIEPVVIDLVSRHAWGSSHIEKALSPGDRLTVPLTLDVPALPHTDSDVADLTVVATLRPDHPLAASLTTTIRDNAPPEVARFRASPGIVDLGRPVNFTVTLTDAIGVANARVFVFDPANATTDYPLANVRGTDTWYASPLLTLVGTYRAYVEATDASANANVNNTRHTPISFAVRATSKPTITLGANAPTTLRSGTPIPVTITDPLGIGEASFVVSGVEVPLPRPYVIDTTNWTTGTIDLTVNAANIYGIANSAHFTLVVDNTPPKILGFTLDPTKPRAGQTVTLRITTDPKVSEVDVVIRKDGVVIDTRPALSQGTGIFVLKYTPEQGDYTFDLVAKDPAGNTKLAEKAVLFSAKPAGALPGFEVWAALAAIGVALAATKRRRGRR